MKKLTADNSNNDKLLRELVSLGSNRQCFDCFEKGVTYTNMTSNIYKEIPADNAFNHHLKNCFHSFYSWKFCLYEMFWNSVSFFVHQK